MDTKKNCLIEIISIMPQLMQHHDRG